MALTALELEQARKALGEVESCKKIRRIWILQIGPLLLYSFVFVHDHAFGSWGSYLVVFLFIAIGIFYWRQYQGLKRRFPANLELLQSLAAREGDMVYHLDFSSYPPLLEAWNRRLERRALLWRVDQFLSGQGWRDDRVPR